VLILVEFEVLNGENSEARKCRGRRLM